jgi:endonuclease YncB( thermonuclease family)
LRWFGTGDEKTMSKSLSKYLTIFPLIVPMLCSQVFADSSQQHYESFKNVQFVKNYDGDSITFNIPKAPAIVGKNMVIRLRGIDTPELKKKTCLAEKEKADAAKQLVYSLLKGARVINLHRIQRGKYFRILADVEFDGQDLATVLLRQELAVKYSGAKKEYNWCLETKTDNSVKYKSRSVLPPKVSGVYVWPPPPVPRTEHEK